MQDTISYEPLDATSAPNHFEPLSGFELTPDDIETTPPATATLFISPEFTNPNGADADRGKTRDYVIVIEYPAGVENTVVRMNNCPTTHGSRMFWKFVDKISDDKSYTSDRIPVEELIENE
jgi:hypothetical protein